MSGNGSPGIAAADAPWRTITISVASGGGTKARCGNCRVMAGTLPAAAGSGGGRGPARRADAGASGPRRLGLLRRVGGPGVRAVVGLALAADLEHLALLARAVDVELAAVALDDQERLAVALLAGVVDEHAVARAGDDLDVVVAGDLLRALALRRAARRAVLALSGGGLGRVVLLDGGGLDLGERRARRARGG